jgi:hypothetical protein
MANCTQIVFLKSGHPWFRRDLAECSRLAQGDGLTWLSRSVLMFLRALVPLISTRKASGQYLFLKSWAVVYSPLKSFTSALRLYQLTWPDLYARTLSHCDGFTVGRGRASVYTFAPHLFILVTSALMVRVATDGPVQGRSPNFIG